MVDLKKDLRAAHFHMGNDQPSYQSSAKSALKQFEITDQNFKEASELQTKMSVPHFMIGDERNRELKSA